MKWIKNSITNHSLHILIMLVLALTVGSIGVGFLVQRNVFVQAFDGFFYNMIANTPRIYLLDLAIVPFNYNFLPTNLSPGRMPSYYYLMFLMTVAYLFVKDRSLIVWVVFCFIGGTFLAYWITFLDWHFVFRTRPFLTLPNPVDDVGRAAWSQLSSFPSGHARETTLYATLIAKFIPSLKWVMLGFVVFIAYSRIYIGAHYPSDVIAGVLIGFLTAKTILLISNELRLIFQKREGVSRETKPRVQSS